MWSNNLSNPYKHIVNIHLKQINKRFNINQDILIDINTQNHSILCSQQLILSLIEVGQIDRWKLLNNKSLSKLNILSLLSDILQVLCSLHYIQYLYLIVACFQISLCLAWSLTLHDDFQHFLRVVEMTSHVHGQSCQHLILFCLRLLQYHVYNSLISSYHLVMTQISQKIVFFSSKQHLSSQNEQLFRYVNL